MKALVKRFIRDERGLETIEYAIMTALIVAVLIVVLGMLGQNIAQRMANVNETIDGMPGSATP